MILFKIYHRSCEINVKAKVELAAGTRGIRIDAKSRRLIHEVREKIILKNSIGETREGRQQYCF